MAECRVVHLIIFVIFIVYIGTISCDEECEDGKFGWKCKFNCACKNGDICNKINGECPNGCKSGYYGNGCLLSSIYRYDAKGVNYTGAVAYTKDFKNCISWNNNLVVHLEQYRQKNFADTDLSNEPLPNNKHAPIPENYLPGAVCRNPSWPFSNPKEYKANPWCFTDAVKLEKGDCDIKLKDCPDGLFGESCIYECHCKDVNEPCDKKTGACNSGCHGGWKGRYCQERCTPGSYGPDCNQQCGYCKEGPCDSETGVCKTGCLPGWQGLDCKQECPAGKYGIKCSLSCGNCLYSDNQQHNTCNKTTGRCPGNACQDGYQGEMCHDFCDEGNFGRGCALTCGLCREGSCNPVNGTCMGGCAAGYDGALCANYCAEGTYGEGCIKKCGHCKGGEPCNRFNGNCVEGCADGYTGDVCAKAMVSDTAEASIIGGVIAAVVIFVAVIIIIIFVYRRRRFQEVLKVQVDEEDIQKSPYKEVDTSHIAKETDQLIEAESPIAARNPHQFDQDNPINYDMKEPIYVNVNSTRQSCPVKVEHLYEYINQNKMHECDGFKKEFGDLPHGLTALCENAKTQANRPKNRYGNIIAYDHSRVVLDQLPNDPSSSYINANYMNGYTQPNAYIASQGPTKVMTVDFWRMVWQKKACKIIMLTNLMEACKKKCDQYWPNEGSAKYGDVTVELLDNLVYFDFTIRTFKLTCASTTRIVKQFHFTTWSDHGALTNPTPLLNFRRKVQLFNPESSAPLIIHCSAGIGRTGTYIAIDYQLQQARAEGAVDVLKCANLMRANRINMIQTWEQYVFVYDALLELLMAKETTIPYSMYRAYYQNICTLRPEDTTTKLDDQFQILQQLSTDVDSAQYKAALLQENLGKNRVKNVLPANFCRPHLYTQVDGSNDYINAIFVPGYTQRDAFIVTQMPLPNTVVDFWRMLYDYNANTVVMLNEFDRNDQSCALYWPEEYGYTVEYGPLSIELLSSQDADPVSVRIFRLSNRLKGEERAVKQFQLKSWSDFQKVPSNAGDLLQLYDSVQDWIKQNGKGPVTVHCMNGASKSGLFCAISLLFERMQRDHEVDIFQTVKTLRINRPQFIEDIEQYQFCYQMALAYLDSQ